MAGYSGTPLAKKLGIKDGARVAVVNAPKGNEAVKEIVRAAKAAKSLTGRQPFHVIVLFCRDSAVLERDFEAARERLDEAGGLWIAWPKRSSGVETDLTEDVVREAALAAGLVDNKVCAIDEVWSGLRLVVRVKDRAGARR